MDQAVCVVNKSILFIHSYKHSELWGGCWLSGRLGWDAESCRINTHHSRLGPHYVPKGHYDDGPVPDKEEWDPIRKDIRG